MHISDLHNNAFPLLYRMSRLLTTCYQLHVGNAHPEIIFQFINNQGRGVLWPLGCHSAALGVQPNRQQ